MKKLIKIGTLAVAAIIAISAGVYAAVNITSYSWTASPQIQFQVESCFVDFSGMAISRGANESGAWAKKSTMTTQTFANFSTYTGDVAAANSLTAWTIADANVLKITEDENVLEITWTIKNAADSKLDIEVTVPATITPKNNTSSKLLFTGGASRDTTGATAATPAGITTAIPAGNKVATKLNDNGDTVTFKFYITLSDPYNAKTFDITSDFASFNFKTVVTKAV